MNFLRKAAIFLVSAVFVGLLFALPALLSINHTIGNSDQIKKWLKDSKLYDNAVTGLVEQANKSIKQQTDGNNNQASDINRPEVQAAAQKAFTPQFLQTSTESGIDGFFNWLKGKTSKPEFSIDLLNVKQKFAAELNAAAKARYAGLPICPKNQPLPSDFDPFTVTCQFRGFNANAEIDKLTNKLINDKDFVAKNSFTADDLKPGGDKGDQQPFYKHVAFLPTLYRLNQLGVIILVVLIIVTGTGIVFLYPARRHGLRRVAIKLLSVGSLIIIGVVLISVVFGLLNKKIETKTSDTPSGLQQSGLYIARQVERGFTTINSWVGVSYIVLGSGTLIALKYVFKPKHAQLDAPKADKPAPTNPKP